MNNRRKILLIIISLALLLCLLPGCGTDKAGSADQSTETAVQEVAYNYSEYPLERNGIALHLDCMAQEGTRPEKNILLIHGVTYSSHEFDIDYQDYSLVRALAREGYAVWRLDIAGFGQSGAVKDGFVPDSDYAVEDIAAAVDEIARVTGQKAIDLLGWSWGTVTAGRYAAQHSDQINKLVLYAPILCGIGEYEVKEPFHHNTWEHAAEDFQRDENGEIDFSTVDPVVVEMFCSSCWHFDGDQSPNGGRRDLCVAESEKMFDLARIQVPTLVICGDSDPYLNYDLVDKALESLPGGSALEKIPGVSHVVFIEKPYYHEFQEKLFGFLQGAE
jgi:pimeloyl-ACP methyl ester carboxylesterase